MRRATRKRPHLTEPEVSAIRADVAGGSPDGLVAVRFDVSRQTVSSIRRQKYAARPEAPAAIAERWEPLCMSDAEWASWQGSNRSLTNQDQAPRPCDDCLFGFAAEMRAEGRCNGTPMGAAEDDEEEEPVVEITRAKSQPISVSVAAPCGTCTHREVCAIKADVEAAAEADVSLPILNGALKPSLSIALECAFYQRERGVGRPPKVAKDQPERLAREWTPEQRQAAAARLAEGKARKSREREEALSTNAS